MSRFRVEYTKFHVRAIVRERRDRVEGSELAAAKYFPEGRIWLLASDLVLIRREIVKTETGYYLNVTVQQLDSDIKFLIRDRFHGVHFQNFLRPNEELILQIKLWESRRRGRRVRRGPRQIFKLLNNIERFLVAYWDSHIQVYYTRYLPGHICAGNNERALDLVLRISDIEVVVRRTRCSAPVLPLVRGKERLIFVLESLVEVRQVYPSLGRAVCLARLDCRRHGAVLVIIR